MNLIQLLRLDSFFEAIFKSLKPSVFLIRLLSLHLPKAISAQRDPVMSGSTKTLGIRLISL